MAVSFNIVSFSFDESLPVYYQKTPAACTRGAFSGGTALLPETPPGGAVLLLDTSPGAPTVLYIQVGFHPPAGAVGFQRRFAEPCPAAFHCFKAISYSETEPSSVLYAGEAEMPGETWDVVLSPRRLCLSYRQDK